MQANGAALGWTRRVWADGLCGTTVRTASAREPEDHCEGQGLEVKPHLALLGRGMDDAAEKSSIGAEDAFKRVGEWRSGCGCVAGRRGDVAVSSVAVVNHVFTLADGTRAELSRMQDSG